MKDYRIIQGDVRDVLATLADESVHCVVTSPPYWGLRDYGTGEWDGGSGECDHIQKNAARRDAPGGYQNSTNDRSGSKQPSTLNSVLRYADVCGKCGAQRVDRQLGLEPTPGEFVQHMVEIFRDVRRVLRRDGTLWLNLGSSYAGSGRGPTGKTGLGDQALRQGFKSAKDVSKIRSAIDLSAHDTLALRDDLTPDELAYVLAELAAHFRNSGEIAPPSLAVGVDEAVTPLTSSEEV